MSATDTVTKTTGLGMYAVAQHMLDHQLPAPITIDAPRVILGERAVIVQIDRHHTTAWLDSMLIDNETTNPAEVTSNYEHVIYTGRIPSPIGDISVQIRTIRPRVQLHAVPSAVSV